MKRNCLAYPSRSAWLLPLFMILLILLLFLIPAAPGATQNPFTSGTGEPAPPERESAAIRDGSTDKSPPARTGINLPALLSGTILQWQRKLHGALSESLGALNEHPDPWLFITLLAGAFLYGMVHSLGPGHRKTVLVGLFSGGRYSTVDALAAGMGFALLHGGSAVVLLLGLYAFMTGPLSRGMEQTGAFIEKGSFIILALVGLWMIISAVREIMEQRGDRGTEGKDKLAKKSYAIPMVIAAGLVPCPGAALILSFSLVYRILGFGIAAVLAMSLGMGTALFLIAAATGKIGQMLARLGSASGGAKRAERAERISQLLTLAGGVLITLFAISMTISPG